MTPQALAEHLEKDPFTPIRLKLTDGRKIDIDNPDTAFIANLAVYVFRVARKGGHLADESFLISLRHIVSIEQLSNGRPRSPKKR